MSTNVVVPMRERLQQIEQLLAVKKDSMRLIRGGAVAVRFVFCGEEVATSWIWRFGARNTPSNEFWVKFRRRFSEFVDGVAAISSKCFG